MEKAEIYNNKKYIIFLMFAFTFFGLYLDLRALNIDKSLLKEDYDKSEFIFGMYFRYADLAVMFIFTILAYRKEKTPQEKGEEANLNQDN